MKKNIFFSIAIALFLLLLMFGCKNYSTNYNTNTPVSTPTTNQIIMQNIAFIPDSLTISKGTTITWINKDAMTHTVTSGTPILQTGLFDSGDMMQSQSFSYKFDSTGTFKYFCKVHPSLMQAVITVK
ncbi:MAG: cupredoxin domain-containing protein [Ignavibacteriaceae bacterium]